MTTTIEDFEVEVRKLIAAGLKTLNKMVEENDEGLLDERAVKTLETLNKAITEVKKREATATVSNPYVITDSKELESDFQ